jgi:hypothetical protein
VEEYMAMIEREEGQRTTIAAAAALPKNQRLTLAASHVNSPIQTLAQNQCKSKYK